MSKIVDIQLRINDNDVELIAKRKDYTEIQAIELSEIQNEIKKIISFCENLKTKDEELKEQKEKLLDFVTNHSSDEEKANNPELFDKWLIRKMYKLNDVINHLGIIYKCKKEHISDYEYIPSISSEYWEVVKAKSEKPRNPLLPKEKPQFYESDKTYNKGDYVMSGNKVYQRIAERGNDGSPLLRQSDWKELGEWED